MLSGYRIRLSDCRLLHTSAFPGTTMGRRERDKKLVALHTTLPSRFVSVALRVISKIHLEVSGGAVSASGSAASFTMSICNVPSWVLLSSAFAVTPSFVSRLLRAYATSMARADASMWCDGELLEAAMLIRRIPWKFRRGGGGGG